MSAFVGIFHRDQRPVDSLEVERMLHRVAFRGADGIRKWCRDAIGLGQCMLYTTPESYHERLPMVDPTHGRVLVGDIRLDNRNVLLPAFGLPRDASMTDAELVLRAYARWGEQSPERLLGDFSFAIWDPIRTQLFCARDQFGVRALYYHYSADRFLCTSDLKSLCAASSMSLRVNETRLADFLVPWLEDQESTCYQEILRLPPGHTMTVTPDRVTTQRYWKLDPHRTIAPASDEEYAEGFRAIFTEAVRCRLRSATPMGSMLSGGLDSSSIVCTARRVLNTEPSVSSSGMGAQPAPTFHTFSAVFGSLDFDETPYIQSVVNQGGITPHFVPCERLRPLDDLDLMLDAVGEMFYGPNLCMHMALFRALQTARVRTVMDGFDGDTTVSHGVAHLTALARNGRWVAAMRETRALARNASIPTSRLLLGRVVMPLVPSRAVRTWRHLRGHRESSWDPVIHRDFARRVQLDRRLQTMEFRVARPFRAGREEHHRGLSSGNFPYVLETIDRVAATYGVRMVFPFCDIRLMEYCLALPPEQKLSNGWTRVVMRRAISELPDTIRWRKVKSDYAQMVTLALLRDHRTAIEDVILRNTDVLEPYFDIPTLRARYRRYAERRSSQDAITVWQAVTLSRWLQKQGGMTM